MKKALLAVTLLMFTGLANAAPTSVGYTTMTGQIGGFIPSALLIGFGQLVALDMPKTNYQVITCKAKNGNYFFETTVTDAKAKNLSCK